MASARMGTVLGHAIPHLHYMPVFRSSIIRRSLARVSRLPLHPFVFASLFVVHLLAENLDDQVPLADFLGAVAAVAGGAACGMLVLWAVVRRVHAAGLLATILVFWVFLYGAVNDAIGTDDAAADPGRLGPWALAGIVACGFAVGFRSRAHAITPALNLVAVALLLLNLVPVLPHQLRSVTAPVYEPPQAVTLDGARLDGRARHRRDIYYIVLDRYPSQTTLLSPVYGYDNAPFLDGLVARGFTVTNDSLANYHKTALSLASTLNMQYLDAAGMERLAPSPRDWKPVHDMLAGSLAAPRLLEQLGYTYVQIPSWFDAAAAGREVDVRREWQWLSDFGDTLLDTTVLPDLLKAIGAEPVHEHVGNALFQFETLPNLDGVEGPKFVVAHVLLPHPPFVFDADGPIPTAERRSDRCCDPRGRFVEQLKYTNQRVTEVVDALLAGPNEEDPIIVIQADEGPYPLEPVAGWGSATQEQLQEKFGILNAMYTPGIAAKDRLPLKTPVNTFRVLLNAYYGAELPLLKDRVFAFREEPNLYDYVDVTDRFSTSVVDADGVEYVVSPPTTWVPTNPQTYDLTVTNTGEHPWPAEGPDEAALVVQFVPAADAGNTRWTGGQRIPLDRDVPPGTSRTMRITVQPPDADGTYLLRHRLSHGVSWFTAGPEAEVSVQSIPGMWKDLLSATYSFAPQDRWTAGGQRRYEVTVTNAGDATWNAAGPNRVLLGINFGGESDEPHHGWVTDQRFPLDADVAPGDSQVIEVAVTAPSEGGEYVLRHRMIKDGIAWFTEAVSADVTVETPPVDPGSGGIPVAAIVLAAAGAAAVGGGLVALHVVRRRAD